METNEVQTLESTAFVKSRYILSYKLYMKTINCIGSYVQQNLLRMSVLTGIKLDPSGGTDGWRLGEYMYWFNLCCPPCTKTA